MYKTLSLVISLLISSSLGFAAQLGDIKWSFPSAASTSSVVDSEGTIYYGGNDSQFYAISSGGKLKWKYPVGGTVKSTAAIGNDGTIYFGAYNKSFYALTSSGKLKWSFAS